MRLLSIVVVLGVCAGPCMVSACSSEDQELTGGPARGTTPPENDGGDDTVDAGTGAEVDAGSEPEVDAGDDADVDAGNDAGKKSSTTFFVTSVPGGTGGNLGGIDGADQKCQTLATAAGIGDHTWHAYLSVAGTNAKDRIGAGPWQNQKGVVIATTVAALHEGNFNVPGASMIDEKGTAVPNNRHDILTGSNANGTATGDTCQNWTSNNGNQTARVGHSDSDTTANNADKWNFAHTVACTAQAMLNANGEGRLFCFAID